MRVLLVIIFMCSAAFAESAYFMDYRFIDPSDYDESRAGFDEIGMLTGEAATNALKDIIKLDENGMLIALYDFDFSDVETRLEWYNPEQGLVLICSEFGGSIIDINTKLWGNYDPKCSKTSPDGKKRIACTIESEGVRELYYMEKEGDEYVVKQQIGGLGGYYWADDGNIIGMKQVSIEGDDIFLPAVVTFVPVERIHLKAVELKEGEYDKSRVMQPKSLGADANELKGLVEYDGNGFVQSLKTRSGKDLVIVPGLIFSAYYPELDIIRLGFSENIFLYYTYNLTTGDAYDIIGNPETWAISPDGKHRLNFIEDRYWLERKAGDGVFRKVAELLPETIARDWYWADNKTIHIEYRKRQGGQWLRIPVSVKLL